MLIGILGLKGHGKDALCSILLERLAKARRLGLADAVKYAVKHLYDLEHEQVFGSLEAKETLDPRWGMTPREILQRFGTEVGRSVHPDTWIYNLRRDMRSWKTHHGTQHFIVPDVRFPNEAAGIKADGGILVRVIRPGFNTGVAESHASETSAGHVKTDYTVTNDGTLADLEVAASELLKLLYSHGHLSAQEALTAAAPSGRGMGNGDEPS